MSGNRTTVVLGQGGKYPVVGWDVEPLTDGQAVVHLTLKNGQVVAACCLPTLSTGAYVLNFVRDQLMDEGNMLAIVDSRSMSLDLYGHDKAIAQIINKLKAVISSPD